MAIGTPNLEQAIEKAKEREADLGVNLEALSRSSRNQAPGELADDEEKRARRRFLESLYSEDRDAQKAYERIISGNELQDVNFLPRGSLIARTVLRIELRSSGGRLLGYGTGSLIGERVLLTNNHVLKEPEDARYAEAQAHYEVDIDGDPAEATRFALEPDRLFFTSPDLDFTVVAVSAQDKSGSERLGALGWVPLIGATGKAAEGEWLNIVQHPNGERKQISIRENQLLKRADDVLWYSTDTQPGSSGAPVFNNNWLMVALHHMGVPEEKNGKWQTVDGRDYDRTRDDESRIKWVANEGIRVSRIVQTLQNSPVAQNPLIRPILSVDIGDILARLPVLFPDTEDVAGLLAHSVVSQISPKKPVVAPGGPAAPQSPIARKESDMTSRRINVTLEIDDGGGVSVVGSGAAESIAVESFVFEAAAAAAAAKKKPVIKAPVVPKTDWVKGYEPEFLGKKDLRVNLPDLIDELKPQIASLQNAYGQTFTPQQQAAGVLNYLGYSVVMNKERRFAFFSAASVDWSMRPNASGRVDDWLFDDRILRKYQVDDSLYKNDAFDRGHLTRREDMEYGANVNEAIRRANGTCTWTNCTPQHSIFNQDKHPDKAIHLWQGLERYILEESAKAKGFNVQVFTGPIFGAADPKFRGIQIPMDFWKVVVAVTDENKLFATAYILGQKEVIDEFGTAEAAVRVPFGAYGTYQRPISTIENVTGLRFTYGDPKAPKSLGAVDPLAAAMWRPRRRRRGGGTGEAFGVDAGDDALESFDDIVLD